MRRVIERLLEPGYLKEYIIVKEPRRERENIPDISRLRPKDKS